MANLQAAALRDLDVTIGQHGHSVTRHTARLCSVTYTWT